MKTTSGMRRLKTAMMVIASMVVVVIGSAVKPVTVRAAVEVSLTKTELTLAENATDTITATVTGYSSDDSVTWSTNNEAVATVDNTGKITAKTKGTATITATSKESTEATATCTVTVYKPMTSATLATDYNVAVTQAEVLKLVSVVPEDASIEQYTFTLTSSDENVATIDGERTSAVAKLKSKVGETTLTLSIKEPDGSTDFSNITKSTMKLKVFQPVSGLSIEGETKVEKGNTITLTAKTSPENAEVKGTSATWKSNDESIATVTSAGVVEGKKGGTTTITATVEDIDEKKTTATHTVTVEEAVESISLDPTTKTIAIGETLPINATVSPTTATNQELTWSSNSPSVATVDDKGNVKGVGKGTATITAKAKDGSNKEASATITVDETLIYITTDSLPNGVVNVAYEETTLAANGTGTKEWTWAYKSPSTKLPPGLKLSTDGKITGKPTEAGEFKIEFTAKSGSNTNSRTLTLTVLSENVIYTNKNDSEVTAAASSNLASLKPSYVVTVQSKSSTSGLTDSQSTLYEQVKKKFAGVPTDKLKTHFLEIDLADGGVDTKDANGVAEIDLTVAFSDYKTPLMVLRYHEGSVNVLTGLSSKPSAPYTDATYYYDTTNKHFYIYSNKFSSYLIAYPSVDTVTVSFNSNGGSAVDSVYVQSGGSILTMPANPTRSGYTFDGWYTNSGLTTALTNSTTFSSNSTLYAKWTAANSNTETTTNTNTTPTRNGLSPANSPQTSDPIDYIRVFAALIVLGAGLIVVLGLKAKK